MGWKLLVPLLGLLTVVSIVGVSVHLLQTGENVEWLIYISDKDNPLGKPTTIKVWAYDPERIKTYDVVCNITITNESDVVLMDQFSGNPAVYTFNSWHVDEYQLYLSCSANVDGNITNTEYTDNIKYHYPTITLQPTSVKWGRPFDLTITAEYPYNKDVDIYIGDRLYRTTFVNGTVAISNLILYNDTNVTVRFLGANTTYRIGVTPPNIYVNVNPSQVKVKESVTLRAWYEDEYGPIPTNMPIEYIVSCASYDETVPANTSVTITVENPGTCVFTAIAQVNGYTISNTTEFEVLPPEVKDYHLRIAQINPWKYTFEAYVETDIPVNGNLSLIVDGWVFTDNGTKTVWNITRVLELCPGVHNVKMKFASEYGINIEEERTIVVPKYPYNISDVPDSVTIPYGVDWKSKIPRKYSVYTVGFNTSDLLIYVYYPGDAFYQSASKLVRVHIVYPVITINETDYGAFLEIRNGMPGAHVTVYGVKSNGTREIIYQVNLQIGYHATYLPDFDTGYYIAVYSYNGHNLTFIGNKPERIEYITSCVAGLSCIPVAQSEWIKAVFIGGETYTPGKPIILKEGEYLVRILEKDGTSIEYTLRVVAPKVTVYIYADNPHVIIVDAPENITVKIALKSGRVIEVGKGTYTLPEEAVTAYSDYFTVEVLPLHIIP